MHGNEKSVQGDARFGFYGANSKRFFHLWYTIIAPHDDSIDTVIRHTDEALYTAHKAEYNRVVIDK